MLGIVIAVGGDGGSTRTGGAVARGRDAVVGVDANGGIDVVDGGINTDPATAADGCGADRCARMAMPMATIPPARKIKAIAVAARRDDRDLQDSDMTVRDSTSN